MHEPGAMNMAQTRDFLFEIGTEELPPKSLRSLSNALETQVKQGLQQAHLAHGTLHSS